VLLVIDFDKFKFTSIITKPISVPSKEFPSSRPLQLSRHLDDVRTLNLLCVACA